MSKSANQSPLAAYAGRWVALVDGQVAGVGRSPEAAKQLAQRNRPKERMSVRFVEPPGGRPLTLSPLLARIRPLLAQRDQPVYLVGGAVRDALLGRASHDLDFVVPAGAIRLTFHIADALGVPAYVLDRERDIGRVMLPGNDTSLDFSCFRGPDLSADLHDRDFTINAIALPATAETTAGLIDPTGGQKDLQAGLLRLAHPQAMQNDPVRALRAVRQAAAFDFTLTPDTATAVAAAADLLPQVSPERIRDELLKMTDTAVPAQAWQQVQELGLLPVVLPDVAALVGVTQSPPHHEDVWAHTLSVLGWLAQVEAAVLTDNPSHQPFLLPLQKALAPYQARLGEHLARTIDGMIQGHTLLRLGALCHDIGKPATRSEDEDGRIRFFDHDKQGAAITAALLGRLTLSNKAKKHVAGIVRGHMRPLHLTQSQGGTPSRRAAYRFFRDSKTAGLDVCLLALADHLATHDGPGDAASWQTLVDMVTALLHHYFERYEETIAPVPLLDGNELMKALQLPPGPELGRLLRHIAEAQAAGEVTTVAEAIELARREKK